MSLGRHQKAFISSNVYEVHPRKDHRGFDLIFRCAAIRAAVVWHTR